MTEGENRSDMFSQQRAQRLGRRRERDLSNRQQQNDEQREEPSERLRRRRERDMNN